MAIKIFAPYNFIPFSDEINEIPIAYKERTQLPSHAEISKGKLTGRLEYSIKALNDINVGGIGKENKKERPFFKDGNGRFTIPGSTMRGFVRSHVELLSFSYPEMIEDKYYMYRSFAASSKKLRDEYSKRMKREDNLSPVKAGYIFCKKDKAGIKRYYIMPVKGVGETGATFFKVHENMLRACKVLSINEYMFRQTIKTYSEWKEENGYDNNTLSIQENQKRYQDYIDGCLKPYYNQNYKAYRHGDTIRFNYTDGRIDSLNAPNAYYEGIVLNSSMIDGKTHHYLVSGELSDSPIPIDGMYINSYINDLERNKIQNRKLKDEFYAIPQEPVNSNDEITKKGALFFYNIENGKVIGFGPTPYFRIFYDHSVKEGIPYKKINGYDYTKSLFGIANNQESYKSRLSFQNAVCVTNEGSHKKEMLSGGPKASAINMYLVQNGKTERDINTYNDKFELRGYKFYWKRDETISPKSANINFNTEVELVKKGSVFCGTLYFNNLSEDELGLLLLSMQLKNGLNNSKSNETYLIGGEKAYGYGKIAFENIKLYIDDTKASLLNINSVTYEKTQEEIEEYKEKYKEKLNTDYGIDFDNTATVKVLKKYAMMEEEYVDLKNYETGYMSLKQHKSYEPLETAEVILESYQKERNEKQQIENRKKSEAGKKNKTLKVIYRSKNRLDNKTRDIISRELGKKIEEKYENRVINFMSAYDYKETYKIIVFGPDCKEKDIQKEISEIRNDFEGFYYFNGEAVKKL